MNLTRFPPENQDTGLQLPKLEITPAHNLPPSSTPTQHLSPVISTLGAEAKKALEMIGGWWKIKSYDPRVRVRGLTVPGPRAARHREQE